MIVTTNTGMKVRTLAYAWAATSPGAHWTARPTRSRSPGPVALDVGGVAGPHGSLARLQPLRGNGLSAEWDGQTYVVRSYRTPIVKVHAEPARRGQVDVNDTIYSVATSHHQQVAETWVGYAVEWVGAGERRPSARHRPETT